MSKVAVGPRQRRKEARPGEILEAAFEEFALKGFAGTRVDDVALRAGITKGTVYLYFPSKEDLFVATFKEMVQPTLDLLASLATNPKGPAMEILRTYFRFVYDALVHDRRGRELLRLVLADGARFPELAVRWHDEVIGPVNARLAAVLDYGVERGEFRPVAASEFPNLMMAGTVSASIWCTQFGDAYPMDLTAYFDAHLDMLERTLVVGRAGEGR